MGKKIIIVTNNKMVHEKFNKDIEMIYLSNQNFLEVLTCVRDRMHEGHELLTHPLSGSLKPNETPFKSIVISKKKKENIDFGKLSIIEESIQSTIKFTKDKPTPHWIERIMNDFSLIDCSLISNAISNMYCL